MSERVNEISTITAKEALRLVEKGKARFESISHADPFMDATVNSVFIPETGKYVDLGEFRPRTGTVVVPGTLRGRPTDRPVYEDTKELT